MRAERIMAKSWLCSIAFCNRIKEKVYQTQLSVQLFVDVVRFETYLSFALCLDILFSCLVFFIISNIVDENIVRIDYFHHLFCSAKIKFNRFVLENRTVCVVCIYLSVYFSFIIVWVFELKINLKMSSVNLRTVYAFAREMYPKKVSTNIQYGTAGFRAKWVRLKR